jgi:hypothetical protein
MAGDGGIELTHSCSNFVSKIPQCRLETRLQRPLRGRYLLGQAETFQLGRPCATARERLGSDDESLRIEETACATTQPADVEAPHSPLQAAIST